MKVNKKEGPYTIVDFLVNNGAAPNKREAKKLLKTGTVKFKGNIVKDPKFEIKIVSNGEKS
jgi:ribosomal protein S4E